MSENTIEKLREIDTPTLSNAIEKLDVRNRATGFCNRTMRQLTPEMGTLCGYAVTVKALTAVPEPVGREESVGKYLEVCEAIRSAPKPAIVVFQEFGPHPEYSAHIGEVLATMFQRFGAIGVVSDSAVRDLPEIRELKFQAFAPGTVASHANFAIHSVQESIQVCGVKVNPGDLLHGDQNGLIRVPEKGREKLPALAQQVLESEREALEYIKSEDASLEGIKDKLTH